ncbi:MAG: MCE family protein [Alphaproteobacteria bacterium]|jgi:phospholipid/cholesterol/gamma-HCH transport system substrate-binding protein|nr:MCE family protein [Alphaproteobacteria bacterium]MBT4020488.1 MCE family protein [Alphaproteobacteria bacterium]MBT5158251.1 MCE family protein [Alphaproteobacteria bacterium]MBT5918000.1 MCE family protein [Alphaproteobacteria bacterium]MBT6384419.1 MCE family protein [Alphaproteobacteria bacterium]
METRASHLLIGTFVLGMVAAAFSFVMWLAKVEIDREFDHYNIVFEGSVSGLSPAGQVRYNGVPVGVVQTIAIDPKNPAQVIVGIEVASSTPVKEDSVAVLEMQGITGVSYVQLSGGSPESPGLTLKSGQERPVIKSQPSQIDQLFSGAPELINRFIKLVGEATKVFDEDNRKAISEILANAQEVTGTVSGRSDELDGILRDFAKTTSELQGAVSSASQLLQALEEDADKLTESADVSLAMMRGTLSSLDNTMERSIQPMLSQTKNTAASIEKLSDQFNVLLTDNSEALNGFFGDGLFEFTRLVGEMRLLVDNLNRVTARIESDPAQFLFGNSQRGFKAE